MKISKALVFDIKRFAIHDGSGLRTTVFFKGCPLRCLWCQNPEGLNTQRQVIYFKNKCIHCRCCQQFKEQINYQNDRPYFQNHQDFDQVIKTCPSSAIQYDSQEYTLDKLMNKIKEDAASNLVHAIYYFKNNDNSTGSSYGNKANSLMDEAIQYQNARNKLVNDNPNLFR